MSLSAQQPSQTPIIASGLFNFRHIAPIFLVPHAPHTTLSHIDLTPVPRALMRIVPAPPRPPRGTQPMTTPTTSVATRIAAAILCVCFSTHAFADRQLTTPGIVAADTAPLRPFTVAGEIIDEHANPAPGVTVTILTYGGESITDELGRYIIDTRIPFDADAISIAASLPDEHTGQRVTTRTASIEHDDPFLDVGVLEMRSDECAPAWVNEIGMLGMNNWVEALTVFDDGSGDGPALYAGGNFTGSPADRIARWDGTQWSALGSGITSTTSPGVFALAVFDDGSEAGPALYAGGRFTEAGGNPASNIARWDGTQWSPLGNPESEGVNGSIFALKVFDDGTGDALYAGGDFSAAAGISAIYIARWDGTSWSPLGSGMNGAVWALTVFDDGSGGGPAMYAGGGFTQAGGSPASNIARWDGTQWSPLGSGLNGWVSALTVFDDGSGGGPALYAGGYFTQAGGNPANRIARWDGTQWSALGAGVSGLVSSLSVFDDGSGSGPALYAGGQFTSAGDVEANHIARWHGSQWSALGSGLSGSVSTLSVFALTVFDDGSEGGPTLYAGGRFSEAGGVASRSIAKWQGCPDITPAPCPGDINADGVVNLDDFIILAGNFGSGPGMTPPQGDLNGDGFVDLDDFIILAGNFGTDCNE